MLYWSVRIDGCRRVWRRIPSCCLRHVVPAIWRRKSLANDELGRGRGRGRRKAKVGVEAMTIGNLCCESQKYDLPVGVTDIWQGQAGGTCELHVNNNIIDTDLMQVTSVIPLARNS